MRNIDTLSKAASEWWYQRFVQPIDPVFKSILKEKIVKAFGDGSKTITIKTTDVPLGILYETCVEAKVDINNAPQMTTMIIDPGLFITVKEGESGMLNYIYEGDKE